jgi:glycosyltransferase involved in cell wall biosynthesis
VSLLKDGPDIHWVFLGDGSRREWLVAEVARRGLQSSVHLVDRQPLQAMPAWFSTVDAVLVSLDKDPILSLTIPSKVQSYLAAGVPILASLDGAGARVVEESGAGFVSPARDAAGLAANAQRMAALPAEERAALGARGRAHYARSFSRARCVELAEELLVRVSREGGGGRQR